MSAIQFAKAAIAQRGKASTEDILTAELRFGFWTSLLDSRYEIMWPKIIADVFPRMATRIDRFPLLYSGGTKQFDATAENILNSN